MKMVSRKNQFGINLSRKKSISQHDLYTLEGNHIKGLFKIETKHSLFDVTFYYDTRGFIPLLNYLQQPISKDDFMKLVQSFLNTFIEIEKNYLNLNQLILDFNYIYVSSSYEIYFAYVPHNDYIQEYSLKQMMTDLVQYCHFKSGEGGEYIQDYLHVIQGNLYFSYHDLIKWISVPEEKKPATSELNYTIELNPPKIPYLFRIANEEKIELNSFPFSIGAANGNSYIVNDNRAISRRHALITKEESQYFIEDLGSTNFTFINDEKINEKTVLEEGNITLANEAFEFHYG